MFEGIVIGVVQSEKNVTREMERSSKIILKILLLLFQNHLRITAPAPIPKRPIYVY